MGTPGDGQHNPITTSSPPPITHALEALLNNLDPPLIEEIQHGDSEMPTELSQLDQLVQAAPAEQEIASESVLQKSDLPMTDVQVPHVPATTFEHISLQSGAPIVGELASAVQATVSENTPLQLDLSLMETQASDEHPQADLSTVGVAAFPQNETPAVESEHPEWEEDSDPLSSSDSSSDSDSSDDDSEEGDDSFKRLTVAEQARILMDEGGSDDEGLSMKGFKEPMQTKNELDEEVLPKPDVTITPEMKIHELGEVLTIVEGPVTTVTIKAGESGEVPRLDTGSVLCSQDRIVIAAISDVFGPVPQPFYTMRFKDAAEVTKAGLSKGTLVFYSELHAKYVFPNDLRRFKGTDASNIHDEEVDDKEMEFSDDEEERAFKARQKEKNREKNKDRMRGGKSRQDGAGRSGYNSQQGRTSAGKSELNYDDTDTDGYTPLQRPVGFQNGAGRDTGGWDSNTGNDKQGWNGGRGGRFNGRGSEYSRGRGGDRGRGRGGYENRRGGGNFQLQGNYSNRINPPSSQNHGYPGQANQSAPTYSPQQPSASQFGQWTQHIAPTTSSSGAGNLTSYSAQQTQMWQLPPYPGQSGNGFPSPAQTYPPPPPLPLNAFTGAYINPNFFPAGQLAAPSQQNQQNYPNQQPNPPGGPSR
ncbi:Gar1/Naf1 RNA binding region-domain-containing protein [Bisporella sp. PMI_857]|nr:Gar1/Naf1 RNA binding region-domain-containing protein [Bisporella sp. PMI_857]